MAKMGHLEFEVRNAIAVVALTLAASAILVRLLTWLQNVLWEPLRLKQFMAKQGMGWPPFRFIVGNGPEAATYAQSLPEALPLDDKFGHFSPTMTSHDALYFPKYGTQSISWHWEEPLDTFNLQTLKWKKIRFAPSRVSGFRTSLKNFFPRVETLLSWMSIVFNSILKLLHLINQYTGTSSHKGVWTSTTWWLWYPPVATSPIGSVNPKSWVFDPQKHRRMNVFNGQIVGVPKSWA